MTAQSQDELLQETQRLSVGQLSGLNFATDWDAVLRLPASGEEVLPYSYVRSTSSATDTSPQIFAPLNTMVVYENDPGEQQLQFGVGPVLVPEVYAHRSLAWVKSAWLSTLAHLDSDNNDSTGTRAAADRTTYDPETPIRILGSLQQALLRRAGDAYDNVVGTGGAGSFVPPQNTTGRSASASVSPAKSSVGRARRAWV